MSENRLEVLQYADRRSAHSQSVDLRIGKKAVVTPNFCLRVKSEQELDLFLNLKAKYPLSFVSSYVVRLLDAPRTLYPKIKNLAQTGLFGEIAKTPYVSSLDSDLIFIDLGLEYLYYHSENVLQRITSSFIIPRIFRDYAKKCLSEKKRMTSSYEFLKWRDAFHRKFWNTLYEDDSQRTKMIRDSHNLEIKFRADILIPPTPLITSDRLLDMTILINERSRELARGKRESADYFLLRVDALRDNDIMDKIKQCVESSEDTRLTIFKFKNMNLNSEERTSEKKAFKDLLIELSYITRHSENKAFMLLDAANQVFPAALTGFNIVSASFNGDKEDRHMRIERSPYGSWYDPDYMVFRTRKQLLEEIIKNNGGVIPCHCPECTSPSGLLSEDCIEYNRAVKRHYLFARETEMKEIFEAIKKKTTSMGADKLQRSSLKNLIDLIP